MRHFYLIKNPEKAGADKVARDICRYIESRKGVCVVREQEMAGSSTKSEWRGLERWLSG